MTAAEIRAKAAANRKAMKTATGKVLAMRKELDRLYRELMAA
jgi:hypothetical protein